MTVLPDYAVIDSLRTQGIEKDPYARVAIDRTGKIVDLNEESEFLFGYQRNDLIGQPIEILLPAARHEAHIQHLKDYFKRPIRRFMGVSLNVQGITRDGEEFGAEVRLAPLAVEGEAGGVFVWAVISRLET